MASGRVVRSTRKLKLTKPVKISPSIYKLAKVEIFLFISIQDLVNILFHKIREIIVLKLFFHDDKRLRICESYFVLFQGVMNNNHVVLNSYHSGTGSWGEEEKQPLIIMCNDGTAFR